MDLYNPLADGRREPAFGRQVAVMGRALANWLGILTKRGPPKPFPLPSPEVIALHTGVEPSTRKHAPR
jgi:hypothetical protein